MKIKIRLELSGKIGISRKKWSVIILSVVLLALFILLKL